MNKEKLLTIIVLVLVIINITLLASIVIKNKNQVQSEFRPPHDRNEMKLKREFNFDDAQMDEFKISKDKHLQIMIHTHKSLFDLSQRYYFNDTAENIDKDSLLSLIHIENDKIYKSNSLHFDELKEICTEDQLPKVKGFINNLLHRDNNRGPKREHH